MERGTILNEKMRTEMENKKRKKKMEKNKYRKEK